ncbi:hypothetical protein ANCDUO_15788 [Ancylostoma duodenale]|uniref:Transmembrane protein 138 n=1 Tax=Ancylostoma duodenale TaxID=51022 RepID=A0A0C2CW19_9BILA|nr:hypothetical protein ANCDUO_15788 [Ancylostoma duodenale]
MKFYFFEKQSLFFSLQDTLILVSVIVLVIAFSSTFVFQAGLIFLLVRRYSYALISALIYLGFSIGLHYTSMNIRWENAVSSIFYNPYILVLYTAQKFCKFTNFMIGIFKKS